MNSPSPNPESAKALAIGRIIMHLIQYQPHQIQALAEELDREFGAPPAADRRQPKPATTADSPTLRLIR